MKKILLGLTLFYGIIFAEDVKVPEILDMQPPTISASHINDQTFTLYNGTKCYGGASDFTKLSCIFLNIQNALDMKVDDAKFYNPQDAITYNTIEEIKEIGFNGYYSEIEGINNPFKYQVLSMDGNSIRLLDTDYNIYSECSSKLKLKDYISSTAARHGEIVSFDGKFYIANIAKKWATPKQIRDYINSCLPDLKKAILKKQEELEKYNLNKQSWNNQGAVNDKNGY